MSEMKDNGPFLLPIESPLAMTYRKQNAYLDVHTSPFSAWTDKWKRVRPTSFQEAFTMYQRCLETWWACTRPQGPQTLDVDCPPPPKSLLLTIWAKRDLVGPGLPIEKLQRHLTFGAPGHDSHLAM